MAEGEKQDTPRILHIASWAMAGVGAFVFAFTMGFLAFQSAQNPLLASTTSNNCTSGQVAINNYPERITSTAGGHQVYYTKMGENYWRCSLVKVNGLNANEPCNSTANVAAVKAILGGGKIGGQPIQFVRDKTAFDALAGNQMKYAIIESSLKPQCLGAPEGQYGGSKDYDPITTANEDPVTPVSTNTSYTAQPAGGPPGGEREQPVVPVTTSGEASVSGATPQSIAVSNKEYNDKAAACLREVTVKINALPAPLMDVVTFSARLKIIIGYRSDRKTQYEKCRNLLAEIKEKYPDAAQEETEQPTPGSTQTTTQTTKYSVYGTVRKDDNSLATRGYVCVILKNSAKNTPDYWSTRKASLESNGGFGPIIFTPEEINANDTIFMFALDNGGAWGRTQIAKVEKSTVNLFQPRTGGYAVYSFSPVLYKVPFTFGMRLPIPQSEWYACNGASAK